MAETKTKNVIEWMDKVLEKKQQAVVTMVKKEFPASRTINLKSANTKNPKIIMIQIPALFCEKNPSGGLVFYNIEGHSAFTSVPIDLEALE